MSVVGHRIRTSPVAAGALVVYGIVLTVVGLWPEHVDEGAGRLEDRLLQLLPWLTYDVLEFCANIVFFMPLGVIGALFLKRGATALIGVPMLSLFASALIESFQQSMLPGRTGSTLDILANTLGGLIGCVVVVAVREAYHRITGRPRSWEVVTAPVAATAPVASTHGPREERSVTLATQRGVA